MSVSSKLRQLLGSADEAVVERLNAYAALALQWNRHINITGARSTEDFARDHIADCWHVVSYVPAEARRAVDVGAGAGLPGLVVAIARPELEVDLVEPVQKKHAFLRTAVRQLGVANARTWPTRVEDHSARDYDVAMSRATWPIDEWLSRGLGLIRPGGLVIGMEGKERQALPQGAVRHPYQLGARTRAIVVLGG
jgi:16S rRNA (guanine527-N7)-methyltransferase